MTGLVVAYAGALGVSFTAGLTWAAHSPPVRPGDAAPPRLVGAALGNGRDCNQLLRWYVDRALPDVTAYGWTSPAIYHSSAAGAAGAAGAPHAGDSGPVPAEGSAG